MRALSESVWIMNGGYPGTFKYHNTAFNEVWAWTHRNLYKRLNTVTIAEVRL